jgi:hypothetical protein
MRGKLLDNHSERVRNRTQATFLDHGTLIGTSEPGRKKATTGTATPTGYISQMVRCARVGSIASSNHTKEDALRDHRLRRKLIKKHDDLNLSLH